MAYLVNVCLTIILGFVYKAKPTPKRKRAYLTIICLCLAFVAGMRGIYALGDTDSYYAGFNGAMGVPFLSYLSGLTNDYAYYILNWFFANMGVPWQVYLFLVSVFVLGGFFYFINKYSHNPVVSVIVFEVLFLNIWMGSLRQACGMCLLLIAYDRLKNKKYVQSVILYVLAVLFHSTALVCIPFILLRLIKVNQATLIILPAIVVFSFLLRNQFLAFINVLAGELNRNQYLTFYEVSPTNLILLLSGIFIFSLCRADYILNKFSDAGDVFLGLCIMLALLSLGGGVVVRLSWYYGIFLCLMIPMIIDSIKPSWIVEFLMMVALLILYLLNLDYSTYYFFWQAPLIL